MCVHVFMHSNVKVESGWNNIVGGGGSEGNSYTKHLLFKKGKSNLLIVTTSFKKCELFLISKVMCSVLFSVFMLGFAGGF